MLRTGGVIAMTMATLLICCASKSLQEQDVSMSDHTGDNYNSGHPRSVSTQGDGHLVRQVREANRISNSPLRRYEFGSLRRYPWPFVSPMEFGYYGEGLPKRNFDEIDRSNLDSFVRKRNFDEIDRTSMPFPYKRTFSGHNSNLDSFLRKRNFDEIDQTSMPFPYKRSANIRNLNHQDRSLFEDIDVSQLPISSMRLYSD